MLNNVKKFFLVSVIFLMAVTAFSQSSKFTQKIQWKSDPNAFEYKVEIQNTETSIKETVTTDKTFLSFSKVPGKYRFRVIPLDFLGREGSPSQWQIFEIKKALKPEIANSKENIKLPVTEEGKTRTSNVEIPADALNVTPESKVVIHNVKTDEKVNAKIKISDSASGKIIAENISEGDWKVEITNPGGLKTESPVFSVKEDKEKIRRIEEEKARAEEERRIAEEKARAEEERRIAEEKARGEEERRIAEEKVRAEEERRIAEEKARAEEERRIAEEKARAEEERRIAEEKARAEEERRIAKEKVRSEKKSRNGESFTLNILGGIGTSLVHDGGELFNYFDDDLKLSYTADIAFAFPLKKAPFIQTGFELKGYAFQFDRNTDYENNELEVWTPLLDIFIQFELMKKRLYAGIDGGFGISVLNISQNINSSKTVKSYGELTYNLGGYLIVRPMKYLSFKAGTDFVYISMEKPASFINPYISAGLSW